MALQYSTQSATGGFNDGSGTVINQPPNGLTPGFAGSNGSQAQGVRHANVIGAERDLHQRPGAVGGVGRVQQEGPAVREHRRARSGCTSSAPCIYNANDYDYTLTGAYDFGTIMKSFGLRLGVVYEHTNYQVQNLDAIDERP